MTHFSLCSPLSPPVSPPLQLDFTPHQARQLFLALHAAIMRAAACIHRFQLRIERLTGYPFIGYRDTQFHITSLAQSAIFSRPSSTSLRPSLGIGRINMHKMLMGEKQAREREREKEMLVLFDILYCRIFIGDTPVSRGFPCKKFQVMGLECLK